MMHHQYTRKYKKVTDFEPSGLVEISGTLGMGGFHETEKQRRSIMLCIAEFMNEGIKQIKAEWDGPMLRDGYPVSEDEQRMCDGRQ